MSMTDEQIVKALECCENEINFCSICPYFLQNKENDFCKEDMAKDALALIKRQQAEIEELNSLVKEMSDYFPCCIDCEGKTTLGERTDKCVFLIDDTYCATRGLENMVAIKKENQELKAEIKELQEILGGTAKVQSQTCAVVRVKAVREFAERLTDIICEKIEKSMSNPNGDNYFITDVYTDIDNLVREMTEKEGCDGDA